MTIGVVTVTRDVEGLIDGCLQSVRWADEIIVMDGGSHDRTRERARAYTDHVIELPGAAHDRVLWNEGLRRARADWIVLLEADQRAPASFEAEVRRVTAAPGEAAAFRASTRNFFLGYWLRSCGLDPDEHVYLLRRGAGRFEDREEGCLKVDGPVELLATPMDHAAYRTITQAVEKINAHTSGTAREVAVWRRRFLMTKPWRAFKKAYLRQQGSRDGIYGLVYALLLAYGRFLMLAKRWELQQHETTVSSADGEGGD